MRKTLINQRMFHCQLLLHCRLNQAHTYFQATWFFFRGLKSIGNWYNRLWRYWYLVYQWQVGATCYSWGDWNQKTIRNHGKTISLKIIRKTIQPNTFELIIPCLRLCRRVSQCRLWSTVGAQRSWTSWQRLAGWLRRSCVPSVGTGTYREGHIE